MLIVELCSSRRGASFSKKGLGICLCGVGPNSMENNDNLGVGAQEFEYAYENTPIYVKNEHQHIFSKLT